MGDLGSSEIQVQLSVALLQVTRHPDECTGSVTHKAGKLPFRFTCIFRTATEIFRPT